MLGGKIVPNWNDRDDKKQNGKRNGHAEPNSLEANGANEPAQHEKAD